MHSLSEQVRGLCGEARGFLAFACARARSRRVLAAALLRRAASARIRARRSRRFLAASARVAARRRFLKSVRTVQVCVNGLRFSRPHREHLNRTRRPALSRFPRRPAQAW